MNIKETDLRIGNCIYEKFWNSIDGCFEYSLIIVYSIYKTHIICEDDGAYNFSDIEGIPLTEEILLKCGFEKDVNFYFKGICIFKNAYKNVVGLNENDFYFCVERFTIHIKHLHQLQNLYFALTNEELIINLK